MNGKYVTLKMIRYKITIPMTFIKWAQQKLPKTKSPLQINCNGDFKHGGVEYF